MEAKDIISSGILELYATGLASAQEMEQVQQYIAQYPEVAEELAKIERDMETYAHAFAVEPNAAIKDRVFAKIGGNDNHQPASLIGASTSMPAKVVGMAPFWKYAAAASIILLLGSVILNITQYNGKNEIAKNLQQANQSLQQTQQELAVLKQDNNILQSDMGVVQNKYSKAVALKGLEAAPNAAAKIFWMENTGELYIDPSNLPDVPEGKQYQLWGIVDGKPVDAGMILTSKKGDKYRIQKMKSFGHAEAFAITLESEKGNAAPKGPMYVMGKMQ